MQEASPHLAGIAPMTDPYYRTSHWLRLRAAALGRDGHRCTAPGCTARANVVDHIISRRNGGLDTLTNLRSLCAHHDSQIKENTDGKRKNNGKPYLRGCDATGKPLDPEHWWNASTKRDGNLRPKTLKTCV
jgi:HNH endonuclease